MTSAFPAKLRLLSAASALVIASTFTPRLFAAAPVWMGYGGDAQHTALSSVASKPLLTIAWDTPVDLAPQYTGGDLFIHYGSPLVTALDTVIVPVKTGATGGFAVQAINGVTGAPLWSQATDYILPSSGWTPSYGPTLTPANRLYYAGAGGTVYYRDTPDSVTAAASGQLAFYGLGNYSGNPTAYNSNVKINTPITSDAAGNIYFGYQVADPSQVGNLQGGIARISANGVGISMSASTLAAGMTKAAMNSAPALSADGTKIYVALNDGSNGRLVELDSGTLTLVASTASLPTVYDISSASPTVGPDGDIFFGTAGDGYHARGVLHHFSANLSVTKTSGSFGWDDTASIVPISMVPGYSGPSTYLLMVKYNNYANSFAGGDGVNKLAILDPNVTQEDPVTHLPVMKEILTVTAPTPDPEYTQDHPNAVREWCINSAVVDPATDSILVNNEDGKLYRWNLGTNSLTESITLTAGVGEAYTPTLIGTNGEVFAINNSRLFAVVPEPATAALALGGAALFLPRRRPRRP